MPGTASTQDVQPRELAFLGTPRRGPVGAVTGQVKTAGADLASHRNGIQLHTLDFERAKCLNACPISI